MTLSTASEWWWQYNNSAQQYNPTLFITIFAIFCYSISSPIYFVLALPQFDFHCIFSDFIFPIAHTATLMLFISFDYYCYLYDFAALLKLKMYELKGWWWWDCEFIIFASRWICSQSDHKLLFVTLFTHSLTNSLIIFFSCTAATRVLFNFLWSQLAMFLSWHHVIKSNLCHPSYTTVIIIVVVACCYSFK